MSAGLAHLSIQQPDAFCIPFPGAEPFDNTGFYKVVLSEESAQALSRVVNLEMREIGPTMVRGRKPKKPSAKAAPKKVISDTFFKKKAPKKPEEKPEKKPTCPDNPCAKDYKRSQAGHLAIQTQLKRLNSLHADAFPSSAVFDSSGRCRMAFDGAQSFTVEDLLKVAPDCLSIMQLDVSTIQNEMPSTLIYVNMLYLSIL